MFITTAERNQVETTFRSIAEAATLAWNTAKPYAITAARWTWIAIIWSTAIAYALGLITRDLWNWMQPRVMAWIDATVDRYLEPVNQPETVAIEECQPCDDTVDDISEEVTPTPSANPDYSTMNSADLRKHCQQSGIKWRNAHDKGKHLSHSEMIAALLV